MSARAEHYSDEMGEWGWWSEDGSWHRTSHPDAWQVHDEPDPLG